MLAALNLLLEVNELLAMTPHSSTRGQPLLLAINFLLRLDAWAVASAIPIVPTIAMKELRK